MITEILGASFDTSKLQCVWGIVRNISLSLSSFAHCQVVGGKTTGRHERPVGMPQEWVRKTAHFDGIHAEIRFDTGRKCSLASVAQS